MERRNMPWGGAARPLCLWFCAAVAAFCTAGGTALGQDDEGLRPQAYWITLEGMIEDFWAATIAETIDRAIAEAPPDTKPTVIMELNTPGGTVQHSMEISDYIFERRQEVRVVAYVRQSAYSGGTMVALACDRIYMHADSGMMGDVAPIDQTGEILNEKMQTVIRANLVRYANDRYPRALVEAMVTKELEVYAVKRLDEPVDNGVVTYVTGQEWAAMPERDKANYGPPKLVVRKDELLTMNSRQAEGFGFATVVADSEEMLDDLEINPLLVETIELSATQKTLKWLNLFSPILITIGVVLLFIEISHPGFGVPGIAGISCFVAFFLIKMSIGNAHMFELLLFFVGVALLMAEVFIIPGFGVAGVSGILLIFVSLVLAFLNLSVPAGMGAPGGVGETVRSAGWAIVQVSGAFLLAVVIVGFLMRSLPTMPMLNRIIHTHDLATASAGEIEFGHVPGLQEMVGREGVAITALRPAGRAQFGEVPLDVVTDGDFLDRGVHVRILEVHGSRVVVEKVQETV